MRWVFCLLTRIVFTSAAAAGGIYFVARSSLPDLNGDVTVARALSAPVEIVRERHSVHHIRAASRNDVAFGLGYAHAQDRLWQMEINRRIAAGRLAEVFGSVARNNGKFLRTLGLRRNAAAAFSAVKPETPA